MEKPETATMVYDVETAAEVAGVSKYVIYQAIQAGQIPSVRIGRRLRIPKTKFDQLLEGEAATQSASLQTCPPATRF